MRDLDRDPAVLVAALADFALETAAVPRPLQRLDGRSRLRGLRLVR